ncbi:MAG: Na+/H+ antiporter subunit E [Pseudomonadota bacterium]
MPGPLDNDGAKRAERRSFGARMAWLTVLLLAAWLLWSGLYKPLLLGLGLFSVLVTLYLSRRMGYFDTDLYALKISTRLLAFWAWLGKEIIRSSVDVARVILSPRLPVSPTVVEIDSASAHPVDQVTLANSITLTPGTLALDVHNGRILVHALTRDGAKELERGDMNRRVAALREG